MIFMSLPNACHCMPQNLHATITGTGGGLSNTQAPAVSHVCLLCVNALTRERVACFVPMFAGLLWKNTPSTKRMCTRVVVWGQGQRHVRVPHDADVVDVRQVPRHLQILEGKEGNPL